MKKTIAKSNGQPRSFADIHRLCQEVKTIELTIDGQLCPVNFRRLNAAERLKLEEVTDSVMPPIIKGLTPEQDRIDYTNAKFIHDKREVNAKARSLALYWCVPDLQQMKPELKEHDAIRDFVQGSFPEEVLAELEKAVHGSGLSLAEVINFSSSSGSPES
jgi:hypothetical protein